MSFDDWQAEKDFWANRSIDTFDLVDVSYCYTSYQEMEAQPLFDGVNNFCVGSWIRSEDFRRHIECLERRIRELEAK